MEQSLWSIKVRKTFNFNLPRTTLMYSMITIFQIDNTYHIPICIWLMDTHPYNAPLAYVTPTSDMQIKVSMFVDHNGKIYLPYLHEWNPVSAINSNAIFMVEYIK